MCTARRAGRGVEAESPFPICFHSFPALCVLSLASVGCLEEKLCSRAAPLVGVVVVSILMMTKRPTCFVIWGFMGSRGKPSIDPIYPIDS